jgi:hypothetical protein
MIGRTGVERGPDDTAGNNDHERHGGEEDGTCTSDFFGGRTAIVLGAFFAALCFYDAAAFASTRTFKDG